MTQLPPDSNHPLIPILDRPVGDSVNAVDARVLHQALEVDTRFNDWFTRRVEALDLVDGIDFEKLNDSAYSDLSSANRSEYVVSLDAAKHIAMAERNEAGRRVRAYFIAMEKRARDPMLALSDPAQLRNLLLNYSERVGLLQAENDTMRPKADGYERLTSAPDTFGFQEACKIIHRRTGANQNVVRGEMLARKWVRYLGGKLQPAHYGAEHGYTTSRVNEWKGENGEMRAKPELRITTKGIERMIVILTGEDAA